MAKKKFKDKEAGSLVGKYPCFIKGGCGSSDACAVYEHTDGSHSAYCWSCEESSPDIDFSTLEENTYSARNSNTTAESYVTMNLPELESVRDDYSVIDNKDRKVRADIYEFYGCRMEVNPDGETIEKIFYPTWRDNLHVGYRIRSRFEVSSPEVKKNPDKLGVLKCFEGKIGDTKKGIELFGQNLFSPENHKRLFITEGEEDAMTGYYMSSKKTKSKEGYAFVSVPSGANVAGLKGNLEYINSFDEIFLCFDNDAKGQELVDKATKFLPVGKVRIMRYPSGIKDISQMWQEARTQGSRSAVLDTFWRKCIFGAEKYSPAGIYSMSEGWSSYLNRGKEILIPFPDSFGEINDKTCGGYALGEIVTIAAPSSVGKSSFVKEMIYTALLETNYKIGICSFEETLDEFIEGMLSVHMSMQLNEIPYDQRDRQMEYEKFKELLQLRLTEIGVNDDEASDDRIHFLDHQGSCDGEGLLDKIDFMINGLDCKIIILDPVTLALSGGDMEEDEFASEIVKRTKRNKLAWINVQHVRKNSGGATANSEGGDIAEEDIKGSGVWFQTSMLTVLLTRNKVHDNSIIRNTTTVKMSKCRRHGKNTGIVGWTYYNGDTGRLERGISPKELEELECDGESGDFDFE